MNKINYIYFGALVIVVITCIIIISIYSRKTENFSSQQTNNIYLTAKDTISFIKNDTDNYIKSLSQYDLIARDVTSPTEYISTIINGCLNFNDFQIEKLNNCSIIARNFFNNKMIWKFALIEDIYEQGFPHTRMDIIFLSPKLLNYIDNSLIKILIHESIHIYQRYNKSSINIYLKEHGYTVSRRRDSEPFIRANPDLDEYIYKNKNGEEMIYKYKSSSPSGINDIIPSDNEHPFETMAYEIAEEYGKFNLSKYKNI
jgi:hypothetical protein